MKEISSGNMFQVRGFVRAIPQYIRTYAGINYVAVVISRDKGQTNLIIYFKGKLATKAFNECVIGSEIVVLGFIASETEVDGIRTQLRQFLVATSLEITKRRALQFSTNILVEPLLALEDEDDIFKRVRRIQKKREREQRKEQEEDDKQSSD